MTDILNNAFGIYQLLVLYICYYLHFCQKQAFDILNKKPIFKEASFKIKVVSIGYTIGRLAFLSEHTHTYTYTHYIKVKPKNNPP